MFPSIKRSLINRTATDLEVIDHVVIDPQDYLTLLNSST